MEVCDFCKRNVKAVGIYLTWIAGFIGVQWIFANTPLVRDGENFQLELFLWATRVLMGLATLMIFFDAVWWRYFYRKKYYNAKGGRWRYRLWFENWLDKSGWFALKILAMGIVGFGSFEFSVLGMSFAEMVAMWARILMWFLGISAIFWSCYVWKKWYRGDQDITGYVSAYSSVLLLGGITAVIIRVISLLI